MSAAESAPISTVRRGFLLAVLLVFSATSATELRAQEPGPDLVLVDGKVVTVDDDFTVAEAVAVADGEIVAVGSTSRIRALAAPRTEVVELEGRTVLPGFFDGHIHLVPGRNPAVQPWKMGLIPAVAPWLTGVVTVEALEEALLARAESTPRGEWIVGDLNRPDWPNQMVPKRDRLDELAPHHPVAISRGPHTIVLNSLALEKAGITRATPNPPGGWIGRTDAGELNGMLYDGAIRHVRRVMPRSPPPDRETRIENLRAQLNALLSLGITSVNVASASPGDFALYQEVVARHGEEIPRMTVQLRLNPDDDVRFPDPEEGIRAAIREMEGFGVRTDFGDDRLEVGAIKMSVDGGLSAPVFWSKWPYESKPDFVGVQEIPEEMLYRVCKAAHEMGWQLGIHAIGDAAVEMAVGVYERILAESPREDHRHYLHHVSVKPSEETLRRMGELGIWVNSQPNFTVTLGSFAVEALEEEREATQNPQRSLVEHGIRVAYGSDRLPFGPLAAIWAAVTRIGFDGRVYGPQEAVTVEEALRFHTRAVAELNFDGDVKGTIEAGKLADLVVLAEDPLTVDPRRIAEIPVDLTYIAGEEVFRREATATAASR